LSYQSDELSALADPCWRVVEHESQVSLCLIHYCSLEHHKYSPLHVQKLLKHPLLQSSAPPMFTQVTDDHGNLAAWLARVYAIAMNARIF